MEKKLKKLFAYQQFEQNPQLKVLLYETKERYSEALTDEELSLVAAGKKEEEDRPKDGSKQD